MILLESGFSHVFRILQQSSDGHSDATGALPTQSLQQILRSLSADAGPHRDPLGRVSIDARPTNMQVSPSIGGATEVYQNRSSRLSQDSGGLGSDERRCGTDQREKKADGEFGEVGRVANARRRLGGALLLEIVEIKLSLKFACVSDHLGNVNKCESFVKTIIEIHV